MPAGLFLCFSSPEFRIISLDRSGCFCYDQKENLNLWKRKVYVSIGTSNHKAITAVVVTTGLPGRRELLLETSWEGRKPFIGRRSPPVTLLPPQFQGAWQPCAGRARNNMVLCYGKMIYNTCRRPGCPSATPPFLACSETFQVKTETKPCT